MRNYYNNTVTFCCSTQYSIFIHNLKLSLNILCYNYLINNTLINDIKYILNIIYYF